MKIVILRIIAVMGLAVFGMAFWFVGSRPAWLEEYATRYVETEVRERIESQIGGIELPPLEGALSQTAPALFERARQELVRKRAEAVERLQAVFARAMAQIRDLDCECRERAWLLSGAQKLELSLTDLATQKLDSLIQTTYMDTVRDLKRDLRIFCASNFGAFALLLVATFTRRENVDLLFVPGLLLAAASLICTWCYVFTQDWLLTIFFRDYVGYAYLAGLAAVYAVLCDVVLNRGRISARLLRAGVGF